MSSAFSRRSSINTFCAKSSSPYDIPSLVHQDTYTVSLVDRLPPVALYTSALPPRISFLRLSSPSIWAKNRSYRSTFNLFAHASYPHRAHTAHVVSPSTRGECHPTRDRATCAESSLRAESIIHPLVSLVLVYGLMRASMPMGTVLYCSTYLCLESVGF